MGGSSVHLMDGHDVMGWGTMADTHAKSKAAKQQAVMSVGTIGWERD